MVVASSFAFELNTFPDYLEFYKRFGTEYDISLLQGNEFAHGIDCAVFSDKERDGALVFVKIHAGGAFYNDDLFRELAFQHKIFSTANISGGNIRKLLGVYFIDDSTTRPRYHVYEFHPDIDKEFIVAHGDQLAHEKFHKNPTYFNAYFHDSDCHLSYLKDGLEARPPLRTFSWDSREDFVTIFKQIIGLFEELDKLKIDTFYDGAFGFTLAISGDGPKKIMFDDLCYIRLRYEEPWMMDLANHISTQLGINLKHFIIKMPHNDQEDTVELRGALFNPLPTYTHDYHFSRMTHFLHGLINWSDAFLGAYVSITTPNRNGLPHNRTFDFLDFIKFAINNSIIVSQLKTFLDRSLIRD